MGKDRLLELAQRLARLEAELVDERRARIVVGGERVGLPARPIQSEDQQLAQALAQRMLPNERLQLAHYLGVAAERQVRLETLRKRDQPQLLQPTDLVTCKVFEPKVREGGTPPELERLPQHTACLLGGTACKQRAASLEQALEPLPIERTFFDTDDVTERMRLDHALAERLSQLRDPDLDCLARGRGRTLTPQGIDEPLRRHRLTGVKEKNGQHSALLRSPERHLTTVLPDLQRAQNAELHPTNVHPPGARSERRFRPRSLPTGSRCGRGRCRCGRSASSPSSSRHS